MRFLPSYLFILTTLVLFSCKTEVNENDNQKNIENATSIKGKFIRVSDNDRAGVEKFVTAIREIEFKGSHCHFKYMGTPMSGKYEIDENYIYITTGGELGMLSLEFINNNHLEGEGFMHGTFKREGTFKKDEIKKRNVNLNPKPNTETTSKQAENPFPNSTYEPSSSPNNSQTYQSDDPFGSGSGYGTQGEGNGKSFGNDSGSGGISGDGRRDERVRLTDPNVENLKSNIDAIIYLKLSVDAEGNVVNASNIHSKTTTTNQILINRVITEVKKQVKYNKLPGAPITSVFLSIKIKAQ